MELQAALEDLLRAAGLDVLDRAQGSGYTRSGQRDRTFVLWAGSAGPNRLLAYDVYVCATPGHALWPRFFAAWDAVKASSSYTAVDPVTVTYDTSPPSMAEGVLVDAVQFTVLADRTADSGH